MKRRGLRPAALAIQASGLFVDSKDVWCRVSALCIFLKQEDIRKLGIKNLRPQKGGSYEDTILSLLFYHLIRFGRWIASSPQVKPLMENDQIKIYEATIKVGVKTLEHSHPADEATYVLSGGKGKVTLPDGTTKVNDYKTGEVTWRTAPETHVAENIGDTEIRLLTIQLKKGQQRAKEP